MENPQGSLWTNAKILMPSNSDAWAAKLEVDEKLRRLAATFGAAGIKPKNLRYNKSQYLKNRDEILKRKRAAYKANPKKYIDSAIENRKKFPNRRRAAEWKKHFGVSAEQVIKRLAEQGGGCAICGVVGPFGTGKDKLVVDHGHDDWVFRGVLCNGCNAGLGMFRDSVSRLQKAIVYLRKMNEKRTQ